jgi:hypothetical protein
MCDLNIVGRSVTYIYNYRTRIFINRGKEPGGGSVMVEEGFALVPLARLSSVQAHLVADGEEWWSPECSPVSSHPW